MKRVLPFLVAALLPAAALAQQGQYINQLPLFTGSIANIILPGMPAGAQPQVGTTYGVTVGTGANQIAAGNDSRFANAIPNILTGITSQAPALAALGLGAASPVQFGTVSMPQNTVLSGGTANTPNVEVTGTISGTSTIIGNTSLASMLVANGNISASLSGAWNEFLAVGHTGTGFNGTLTGVNTQLVLNAATLTNAGWGLVGVQSKVIGAANVGGTATAPVGYIYGANPWAQLQGTGTHYSGISGQETDASMEAGSSADAFDITQLVLTKDHAAHGTYTDAGLVLTAQDTTAVGVRNLIVAGTFASQFPLDPNGYIFQAQGDPSSLPLAGAGGVDLNLFSATGNGLEGGGFYWRSPGVQILSNAAQVGYGSITSGTSGVTIAANYQNMSGTSRTITVANGGSGWVAGQIACDNLGDCVQVQQSAGVVTLVGQVLSSAWAISPPANPVAFTAMSNNNQASGLMLNLVWNPETTVSINPSGGLVQFSGSVWQALLASGTITAPTRLTATGAAPSSGNTLNLAPNSAIDAKCRVVARAATGETIGWDIDFGATQGASASTTAIAGTPSWTQVFATGSAASEISIATPAPDTTLGAVNMTINPSSGTWAVNGSCQMTT
jgi:hypothetical protein